jgi:hypothetical protein
MRNPFNAGQEQRERPQDKKPKNISKTPPIEQVEIESVEDVLEQLEQLKKAEQKRCGCWGN